MPIYNKIVGLIIQILFLCCCYKVSFFSPCVFSSFYVELLFPPSDFSADFSYCGNAVVAQVPLSAHFCLATEEISVCSMLASFNFPTICLRGGTIPGPVLNFNLCVFTVPQNSIKPRVEELVYTKFEWFC